MKIKSIIIMTVSVLVLLLVTGMTIAAQEDGSSESVSANGVIITVGGLNDVRDFYISKGTQAEFSKVKENKVVLISANKIAGASEYSYTVKEPGDYTVLIRHNNTSIPHTYLYVTLEVVRPYFVENGLQMKIGNLDDVKVIRTAYGDYDSLGEIKRAQESRAFTAKTIGNASYYTVQYRENGVVSIGVAYNNGYYEIHKYNVEKKIPAVTQNKNIITFSNLDGLKVLRYAKGEYTTSKQIKNAEGAKALKATSIVNGEISIKLEPGTYSFCVQYDDESYNYYTIAVIDYNVPTAYGIHVSNAFSDNMVIQRDEPFTVWGTAKSPAGTTVLCEVNGEKAMGIVDENGNWKATFGKTFPYSTAGTLLTASCAEGTLSFNNVLFGDVYYVIGQSNVFYSIGELLIDLRLKGLSDQLSIDYDNNRNIRFFRISNSDYVMQTGELAQGTPTEYTDVYNGEYWKLPSDIEEQVLTFANFTPSSDMYNRNYISENVFSALGYIFAYNMSNRSDIPIGMIEIDAAGNPLISFAPNELAEKWGNEIYDPVTGTYHYKLKDVESSAQKSRFVYNQQINPLKNFACAGVIWYQGESDWYNTREFQGVESDTFATQFAELMTYYRSVFGNSDFPIYMIEFPSVYSNNSTNSFIDFYSVKTEQGTIPQLLSDCYIVSCSDFWFDTLWYNNIHPPIKHLQAFRLTDIVMADKFEIGNMENVHGPTLREVVYEGNSKAYLHFDCVGEGLNTADSSGVVKGLEIYLNVNGNLSWIGHEGRIITGKDKITVDAGSFELLGVRYNRKTEGNYPHTVNLCNAYGMPAIAFVDYNTDRVIKATPKKYFTISLDDGITQDAQVIEILKKYNVNCCSFNLNTGLCGVNWDWISEVVGNPAVTHIRFTREEIKNGVYDGFDVLGHTRTHVALNTYDNDPDMIVNEVEGCANDILELTGTKPLGMVWPGDDTTRTPTTVKHVYEKTSCRFARAYSSTYNYNLPSCFLEWHPTCQVTDANVLTYAKNFLDTPCTQNQVFFVWGHSFELQAYNYYDEFEQLIKMMSESADVVLVTNSEFYEIFKDDIPSCIY